jgi:hypothetical protein
VKGVVGSLKPARAKTGSASKKLELEPKFQFYGSIFNPLQAPNPLQTPSEHLPNPFDRFRLASNPKKQNRPFHHLPQTKTGRDDKTPDWMSDVSD